MSRKRKKPIVLVLEAPDPSQNIILALEDLERNNGHLRRAMQAADRQIDKLKDILRRI